MGRLGIFTLWAKPNPTSKKTKEANIFVDILSGYICSLVKEKTARLQEQLPSELNSWSRDQEQFMQNSKVRWKALNDNFHRKTSPWNKAWRSHDAALTIWLELRNEHISRSTKRPPFSLICQDRESNDFLNLDIWWFEWFSLLQCSYIMKLSWLMCFLVMTNNQPEWPLYLGGQATIFTF